MADSDIQTSFAAGELSPQLYARVDLDKFQVGAALLRNFFVDYRGGASNRAGTEYIAEVSEGDRLIPFIVSTEAAYVLVFSTHLISVYLRGVFITTVSTPYEEADLFTLAYTQSADVLTIVHPNYPPADVSRLTPTHFIYTVISTGPNVDPPVVTDMVAPHSGPYSFGYLVTSVGQDGKEESLGSNPAVKHSEGMDELTNRVIGLSWDPPTQPVLRYNIYKWGPIDAVTLNPATVWGFIGSSQTTTFTDNNIAPDFSKQPPGWGDPFSGGQFESITVASGGAGYDGVSGDWPVIPYVPLTITGDGTDAAGYAVIDHANGTIIGVYLTNSGKNYTTATVTANGEGGAGATFNYTFTDIRPLNPAATAYLQQRRVFGGSTLKPETLVMSQPGLINNFNFTPVTLADDSIVMSIAAEEVNTIKSFVQVNYGLLAFTTGGSFLVNGGSPGAAIDANSPSVQPQVSQGANDLRPLRINYDVIYGQAKGNRIHNLAFAWQKQSYAGGDISMLAAHLFDTFRTVDWTYAEEPFKIVWAVRNDGKLLSLTYVPDQEVYAWCRHDTQGMFKSVCSVPEDDVDAVYFIVARHIPNNTGQPCWRYYLERMAERQGCCIFDAWHLDSALSFPRPTNPSTLYIAPVIAPAVSMNFSETINVTEFDADTRIHLDISITVDMDIYPGGSPAHFSAGIAISGDVARDGTDVSVATSYFFSDPGSVGFSALQIVDDVVVSFMASTTSDGSSEDDAEGMARAIVAMKHMFDQESNIAAQPFRGFTSFDYLALQLSTDSAASMSEDTSEANALVVSKNITTQMCAFALDYWAKGVAAAKPVIEVYGMADTDCSFDGYTGVVTVVGPPDVTDLVDVIIFKSGQITGSVYDSTQVDMTTYDPCTGTPTGSFGGEANVPSVEGIQSFDLSPMTHRNGGPSVDFAGRRLFVGNAFDGEIASYSFDTFALLAGPTVSPNSTYGLMYAEDGLLYGWTIATNCATLQQMRATDFFTQQTFGAASASFATDATHWAFPRDVDTVAWDHEYLVSTALNASQTSGQISVLTIDGVIAWDGVDLHTDEFLGVVTKGNPDGAFGVAWVVTQTNNLGGSITLGLYQVLLNGGASSMNKIGLIDPASIGSGWTHSTACKGIVLDQTDGNIIAHYTTLDLAAWSAVSNYAAGDLVSSAFHDFASKVGGNLNHSPTIGGDAFWTDLGEPNNFSTGEARIVKIDVTSGAILWSTVIVTPGATQIINQSEIKYGRYNWLDTVSPHCVQHSINTLTGEDITSSDLTIMTAGTDQFTSDFNGNIYADVDWTAGSVVGIGSTPDPFSSWATLGPAAGPVIPAAIPPSVVGYVIQVGCGKATITSQTSDSQVTGLITEPFDNFIPDDPNGLYEPVPTGGWTITKPVNFLSGLEHLRCKDVYALADGVVVGPMPVVDGAVTLPFSATNIVVGLKYTQQIQTLYLTTQGIQSGSDQGKRKQISGVTVRTDCTKGLSAGTDFDALTPIPEVNQDLTGATLYTGDARVLSYPKWDRPGQTCIQQDYPLPATVLGVIVEVTPGDTSS